MAQTNKEIFRVFEFVCICLLIQRSHAFEFKVGGSKGWTVPSDTSTPIYNQWAERNRFQIGDTLLFVYNGDQDSVLHVTKEDYTNCNTESPLHKYTDGNTQYKFDHSGPHYFISGVADNCHKNEKLVVVVMADRSQHHSNETASSPPPSPSDLPPSPAPAGEESPSPPSPASSEDSSPGSEAPSDESSHPKNGASYMVTNLMGLIVAGFVGSSIVLAM